MKTFVLAIDKLDSCKYDGEYVINDCIKDYDFMSFKFSTKKMQRNAIEQGLSSTIILRNMRKKGYRLPVRRFTVIPDDSIIDEYYVSRQNSHKPYYKIRLIMIIE